MNNAFESNHVIKIPINKLTLGMFVTAIDEHQNKVDIRNPGQIKHQDAIDKLKQNNITTVWVDIGRSSAHCGLSQSNQSNDHINPLVKKSTVTRHTQQTQAKQLIAETKMLIQKVMFDTFEGKVLEVSRFETIADKIIKLIVDNEDALNCVLAMRTKDAYLLEHAINVAFLLVTFGKYLQLDTESLRQMAIGGILHDIGKVKINDEILHKPDMFTPEEFEYMKMHQVYASEMIDEIDGLSQISKNVCLMHHEQLNGNGYPNGLMGDEITLHGRMSCIVDIFDALIATRTYKASMSPAAAFKILIKLTPNQLDQSLVYEFIRCVGVYPVGSLVLLSDERIGIVWEVKNCDPLQPIVKCFYSQKHKHYIDIVMVDLLKTDVVIERGITAESYNINPTPFY